MGEAKRREKEIASIKKQETEWRNGLTQEELVILELAKRLDKRFVRGRNFSEGCYHLAFFMTKYLAVQGIEVNPVVGWVNDGLWEGVTSHAWIEFDGRITDASLTFTSNPDAQPTGSLIVLDHVLRKGTVSYSYYKEGEPVVLKRLEWMRTVPEFKAILKHKLHEHQTMLGIALSKSVDEYLAKAPSGTRYADIVSVIE